MSGVEATSTRCRGGRHDHSRSVTIDDSTFQLERRLRLGRHRGRRRQTHGRGRPRTTAPSGRPLEHVRRRRVYDSAFNENTADFGLDISALGDVSLFRVEALANGDYGASISNAGKHDHHLRVSSRQPGRLWPVHIHGRRCDADHVEANENATFLVRQIGNGGSTSITAAFSTATWAPSD